jgi:D-aminoacyl-tRNA deacylase
MRAVIQRVLEASVTIDEEIYSTISNGLVVLIGIEDADNSEDIIWMSKKICSLRIFDDEKGTMNYSIKDMDGEIIVISQFTLYSSTNKGNRPSFLKASKREYALPLYQQLVNQVENDIGRKIKTGIFGSNMKVALINDGPVTIVIDTKIRE